MLLQQTRSARRAPLPVTLELPALPAWPVEMLLWGFPAFWLLGLLPFIVPIMAIIMAALLLAHRYLTTVPGVAPWFMFVAWTIPCALMLEEPLRLIGYSQRVANYVAVAVVLLYVVNARRELPTHRVLRGLTVIWVTTVIGGYLGMLFPDVRLVTPVGLLLPDAITSNEYVHDLLFPPLAEVQQPWGVEEPYIRPSAPFPYTNGWGSALVLLTPVAVVVTSLSRSRGTKLFLILCTVAAIAPASATLNRGLLLGLALIFSYVAVRLVFHGHLLPFLLLTGGLVVIAFAASSTGLLDGISERAEHGSTDDRATLYRETVERTLESPIFGYGAPRPSDTVGVSVGTQGQIWMVMFSFGLVGLALFLWFLFGTVIRTWHSATTASLWLHSSLLACCLLIFFYGLDTMQLLTVALVAALLLRNQVLPKRGNGLLRERVSR